MTIYQSGELKTFVTNVLIKLQVQPVQAAIVADALIKADLEGVPSHGISRLPIYAKRLREGKINADPKLKIERKAPAVLMVDGDNGLGQVVSFEAFQEGINVAKKMGIAAVAVCNSNHFGCASYYCQLGFEKNIGSIITTNSPPGIPPWGGKQAFFGTNPIAFGFPVQGAENVIIDMSSSVAARGKIIQAARTGEPIPEGWAIDEKGQPTTDAAAALKGAVLPAGGVKGYGLALAVEILSAVLTGAAYGPYVQSIYSDEEGPANIGHCFILLDIEAFKPVPHFSQVLKTLLDDVKSSPKADGTDAILYPGERRAAFFRNNLLNGIKLSSETIASLRVLSSEHGVLFPDSIDNK